MIGFLDGSILCPGAGGIRPGAYPFGCAILRSRRRQFGKASRAAYLGHFAENDVYESRSDVDELEETLRKAGRQVTFYHYNGTSHWFFEPDRVDAYNKEAADLAWERTMAFLKDSFGD